MLGQSIMRPVRPLSVRARILAEWCFLPSQRSRVQARNSRQGHRNNRSNKLLQRRRRLKNPPQNLQLPIHPQARRNFQKLLYRETSRNPKNQSPMCRRHNALRRRLRKPPLRGARRRPRKRPLRGTHQRPHKRHWTQR